MHAAPTRSDAEPVEPACVQPSGARCVPGRAAPTPTIAQFRWPRPDPAEARLKALGVPIGRPIGEPVGDTAATGLAPPGVEASAWRQPPTAPPAASDSRPARLAGFALLTRSCRAGRAGSLRGASARADLRRAATAGAVGTGGAFATASSRAGSRRPRTIFCRRLRLSDQLAMYGRLGRAAAPGGLRRRQNRLSGARPRMRGPGAVAPADHRPQQRADAQGGTRFHARADPGQVGRSSRPWCANSTISVGDLPGCGVEVGHRPFDRVGVLDEPAPHVLAGSRREARRSAGARLTVPSTTCSCQSTDTGRRARARGRGWGRSSASRACARSR